MMNIRDLFVCLWKRLLTHFIAGQGKFATERKRLPKRERERERKKEWRGKRSKREQ